MKIEGMSLAVCFGLSTGRVEKGCKLMHKILIDRVIHFLSDMFSIHACFSPQQMSMSKVQQQAGQEEFLIDQEGRGHASSVSTLAGGPLILSSLSGCLPAKSCALIIKRLGVLCICRSL